MIAAVPGGHLFLGGLVAGGSLKCHLMARLLDKADLAPGRLVADLSAGHGALALARAARQRSLRCRVYLPDSAAAQIIADIRQAGAEVRLGPPTAESIASSLRELQKGHASGELYWTRQNYRDCDAYGELAKVLPTPDHLVAGVGTGGSLCSFANHFLKKNPSLKIHAIFSADLAGVRPGGLAFDFGSERDFGSFEALQRRFGTALMVHDIASGELENADSTGAVLAVMRSLNNALGISIDSRGPLEAVAILSECYRKLVQS